MNNRFVINYTPGRGALQRLNGSTKIAAFIVITAYIIMSFDLRLMVLMFILCCSGIRSIKPNWKPILFIVVFLTLSAGVFGSLMIILIKPETGLSHVGGETLLIRLNSRFYITRELLWYVGVMFFKRLTSLSSALVFVLSITPSELAAGLNRMGLPYRACTVISLAFRTIPDIARNFTDITNSLAMRGVELDPKRAGLFRRLLSMPLILTPLIISSFSRVELIANAMDLRSYGKLKRRSWYSHVPPARADYIVRILSGALACFCVYYIINNRIINPPDFDYWCPWIRQRP
jgi:energy-coupling factor transport system permease protein